MIQCRTHTKLLEWFMSGCKSSISSSSQLSTINKLPVLPFIIWILRAHKASNRNECAFQLIDVSVMRTNVKIGTISVVTKNKILLKIKYFSAMLNILPTELCVCDFHVSLFSLLYQTCLGCMELVTSWVTTLK